MKNRQTMGDYGHSNRDKGFPDSSAEKESACNARDPGLIPGSGRSPGEGISSVRSLSHVRLSAIPWTAACQAFLSITNS